MLGCTLGLSAQEAETPKPHDTKVKLSKTADGFANYYSGYYYYHGGEIFNMRNYPMFAGNKISSLRINPSGTSYAFIDNKKDKNSVDVYSLIYKDTRQGKVGTTKLFKPLAICYSPDAKFLYVMGSDKKIHIYTTRKTQEVKNFDVNETASRLDASPNGFFLMASSANKIQVINMENQSVRTTIDLKAELKDIAFSSNSKQMAVLTADGTCDVYDTKTFKVSKHLMLWASPKSATSTLRTNTWLSLPVNSAWHSSTCSMTMIANTLTQRCRHQVYQLHKECEERVLSCLCHQQRYHFYPCGLPLS